MLQAVPQRTRNSAEVQHAPLAGGRLHLNEGPIDLVIGAKGQMNAVAPLTPQLRSDSMGYWTNWWRSCLCCGSRWG